MGIAASELSQFVIRPTLIYLGRHSPSAEALLLGIAASQSALGSALHDRRGHGLYRIGELRHQSIWDQFLARDPELASLVRGLASQHAFLSGPPLELTVKLPAADDLLGLARIWRQTFQPQGRLRDFTCAWQTCIAPVTLEAC
jgi:hypothetical protein